MRFSLIGGGSRDQFVAQALALAGSKDRAAEILINLGATGSQLRGHLKQKIKALQNGFPHNENRVVWGPLRAR
jgi:hypothetical protein